MAGATTSLRLQASQAQLQLQLQPSPTGSIGAVQEASRVGFSPASPSGYVACETLVRPWQHSSPRWRQLGRIMASQAEAAETVASSSCCGGSGAGHGGGGCSGSKRNAADVSGVGKEFEAMVAASTMAELEKGYVKGEMQGMITRDVVEEVMAIPGAANTTNEEKFLDVEEILRDARKMSKGDFIFDAELDDMIV